jgi:hypothetical protein
MTLERRERLIDEEINQQSFPIAAFIRSRNDNLGGDQSWSYYAYSFGEAFDVMWDAAARRPSTLLMPPLLAICRQSVELSIKAGLETLSGQPPPAGHKLAQLWSALVQALDAAGLPTDDEFSQSVGKIVELLDQHDPRGDRFRYPAPIAGQAFCSTDVDLDELFRAHWRLTLYCGAIGDMIKEY